jgi:hypothetical protein
VTAQSGARLAVRRDELERRPGRQGRSNPRHAARIEPGLCRDAVRPIGRRVPMNHQVRRRGRWRAVVREEALERLHEDRRVVQRAEQTTGGASPRLRVAESDERGEPDPVQAAIAGARIRVGPRQAADARVVAPDTDAHRAGDVPAHRREPAGAGPLEGIKICPGRAVRRHLRLVRPDAQVVRAARP